MPRPELNKNTPKVVEKNLKPDGWKFNIIIALLVFQTLVLVASKYKDIVLFLDQGIKVAERYQVSGEIDALDTLQAKSGGLLKNFVVIKPETSNKLNTPSEKEENIDIDRKVRVAVLNGCGIGGLAGKWEKYLKKGNYDVREVDDYRDRISQTLIISRVKDMDYAYSLAKKIGVEDSNVILQRSEAIVDLDITLVLGRDYTILKSSFNE